MIVLSVITPSYNRAHLLGRCFQSMKAQTCMDFEWIIVDDGSTDDTEAVVNGFKAQPHEFDIVYIKKENGGKHTALNAAHPYLRGRYALILDSDDTLTEDAAALVLEHWAHWESHPEIGLITFLKGADRDHPNCYVKDENIPVDIISCPRICPISNDACEVIRTDVLRQFPFPVFPGERFLAEGSLWGRVSFQYQCVYVNRVIYLCEYLEDGLTKSGRSLRIRNPRGGMDNANIYMTTKNSLRSRLKNGLLYTAYGFFAGMRPSEMRKQCDHRKLMDLCLPFGWLLYLFWKWKYLRKSV